MTALKEISKVICVCKYRERQMGKALSQKGFYDKERWIREGAKSIKSLKFEMTLLSTILLLITKSGLFHPEYICYFHLYGPHPLLWPVLLPSWTGRGFWLVLLAICSSSSIAVPMDHINHLSIQTTLMLRTCNSSLLFALLRINPVAFRTFHPMASTHLFTLLIYSSHMPIPFLFLHFSPPCSLCLECLFHALSSFINLLSSPFQTLSFQSHFLISWKVCDWSDVSSYYSHGRCLMFALC